MPIAIVDVDYSNSQPGADPQPGAAAIAACVVAERWTDGVPIETHAVPIKTVQPYAPGRFFERELPCILAVLPRVGAPIDVVVIDGYVFLDQGGAPGLGAHLHAALQGRYPVVGVAKSQFGDGSFATAVLRGASRQPLWITAIGMDVEEAARHVVSMHGPYRIPTLLTWVDRLAAGDPPAWPG